MYVVRAYARRPYIYRPEIAPFARNSSDACTRKSFGPEGAGRELRNITLYGGTRFIVCNTYKVLQRLRMRIRSARFRRVGGGGVPVYNFLVEEKKKTNHLSYLINSLNNLSISLT